MDARDPVARRANHVASLRFNRSNVKPSAQKYFASVFLKIMISFAHPAPARRDVSADRHDTWGGDAMDALRPPDERGAMRTAKSRGPGAPTLASSLLVTNRQATEANKPGTPGRSRISRKPLRRGCRLFRLPCVACVRKSALSLHARLAGAACIRHSLRPRNSRATIDASLGGISRRENTRSWLLRDAARWPDPPARRSGFARAGGATRP